VWNPLRPRGRRDIDKRSILTKTTAYVANSVTRQATAPSREVQATTRPPSNATGTAAKSCYPAADRRLRRGGVAVGCLPPAENLNRRPPPAPRRRQGSGLFDTSHIGALVALTMTATDTAMITAESSVGLVALSFGAGRHRRRGCGREPAVTGSRQRSRLISTTPLRLLEHSQAGCLHSITIHATDGSTIHATTASGRWPCVGRIVAGGAVSIGVALAKTTSPTMSMLLQASCHGPRDGHRRERDQGGEHLRDQPRPLRRPARRLFGQRSTASHCRVPGRTPVNVSTARLSYAVSQRPVSPRQGRYRGIRWFYHHGEVLTTSAAVKFNVPLLPLPPSFFFLSSLTPILFGFVGK